MTSAWRGRATALLLGLIVALGGIEGWLSMWIDQMPSAGVAPRLGTLRGASTMDGLWDPSLRYDDQLGWTLAPGPHPATPDGYAKASTIGDRADRRTGAARRPEATHRVAVFGDSFVFGFGVEDLEAFPARLAAELGPDWQVTNHGVAGYGDDQVALAIDRWMPVLRPDVVVVGHTGDDTWRNVVGWSYSAKRRSWAQGGRWMIEDGPIAPREAVRARWLSRPLLRHLPGLVAEAVTHGGRADNQAVAEAIVHAQVDRIEAAGAIPILVDLRILHAAERDDEVVPRVCGAREVVCVDALPIQQATEAAGEPVFTSSHYSAQTNARLGRALAQVVSAAVAR